MTPNRYTQAIETRLYLAVFLLFAAFIALLIYRSFLDTKATQGASERATSRKAGGIFRPHNQDSAGPEELPPDSEYRP